MHRPLHSGSAAALNRRQFLAAMGLAAAAPREAEALPLADAGRLITENREDGTRFLSAQGEFIGARGAYYAPPVPFSQLPKHLIDALERFSA